MTLKTDDVYTHMYVCVYINIYIYIYILHTLYMYEHTG